MEYTIKGTVVPGRKLGRELGFPTANIVAGPTPGIADGVYAVRVNVDGQSYRGMANLGHKPSVGGTDEERLLEVNIFGFAGDIYGRGISVVLLRYIRPERYFPTLGELRDAIDHDRRAIEKYFEKCRN